MRILVHEFVTGGGWNAHARELAPASLAAEGRAMLTALAADFAGLDDVAVDVLRDRRYGDLEFPHCTVHEVAGPDQERHWIERLAARADWTLLVAPEFDGHLIQRCRWVEQAGGRLLGPGASLVALASDKHRLAEHLRARGIAVPSGIALRPWAPLPVDFPYPAVLKPRDGAGSQGIVRIEAPKQNRRNGVRAGRLEPYCPGQAASVAVLCGPRAIVSLPPCWQWLDENGFAYLGGSLPIDPPLARRAADLARRAVGALDDPLGYLGVDLVLGDDTSGADDVVIEINPRITTSYVGLRALCRDNLAAAILAVVGGQTPRLRWRTGPIEFDAAGVARNRHRKSSKTS